MSSFIQAVKWLQKGKRVRRSSWSNKCFSLHLSNVGYLHASSSKLGFKLGDFTADDWEVYKGQCRKEHENEEEKIQ